MFIIPCKYNSNNPMIQKCVNSISLSNPDEIICVVDSSSNDKSYFKDIDNKNIVIIDNNNANYVEGALWQAYFKFPTEKIYWILHDSTEVVENLSKYSDYDIVPVSYFYDFCYDGMPCWSDNSLRKRELWARQMFNETKSLEFISGHCQAVFGSMMMLSNKIIQELLNENIDKFLPTDKDLAEAMERVWGMIFLQLGYNLPDLSVEGQLMESPDTFKQIKKLHAYRR